MLASVSVIINAVFITNHLRAILIEFVHYSEKRMPKVVILVLREDNERNERKKTENKKIMANVQSVKE